MATAGLRVTSDYGTTQVTNTTAAYGLSGYNSITLTTGGETRMKPYVTATVSAGGVNPLISIRTPSNKRVTLERSSGNTFTFTCQSADPVTIDYWIWDAASVALSDPTLSSLGLRVYSEVGNVKTFDAAMYSMIVRDIVSVPAPGYNGGGTSSNTYQTTAIISVPPGRVYSVIPTSLCILQTSFDTGAYTSNPNNQSETIPDDGGPQPGDTYRRQKLEDYLTTVKSISATEIEVGITMTGSFEGWYPMGAEPKFSASGASNFVVVDVTDYPSSNSGGLPVPPDYTPSAIDFPSISGASNDPSIGINGDSRIWTGFNQELNILVSLSGVSGAAENAKIYCVVNGVIRNTIAITEGGYFNVLVNSSDTMYFYIESSTSSGIKEKAFTATLINTSSGNSVLDTFIGYMKVDADNNYNVLDYTPDPINFPTLSVVSNEYIANSSVNYFQITGINQPISLKFTRDSLTGNLYGRALVVGVADVGAGAGGPWTYYRVGALSTGLQIDDVRNGRWFSVFGELQTDSGVRTGAWQNYVTNLTTGVQLASFRIEGTVDADNNYNIPDWTIDALSIPNQTINTNDYYGGFGISKTITGINQTITIRANVSNRSGNISAGGFYFRKNGADVGTGVLWTAGDDARQTTFVNGDVMEIFVDAQTFSGAKTGQFYTTLTNVTTGEVIGGFWTYCYVDQDNNYNTADYEPDGFSLPTLTVWTNENFAGASSGQDARQLTGFNQPITIRLDLVGASGSVSGGVVRLIRYTPSAGWHEAGLIWLPQGGSCSATFLPGDYVYTDVLAVYTSRGRMDMNFTLRLTNETTGMMITQHAVNLTVDADDNYYDQVADSIYLPPLNFYSTTGYGSAQTNFTVTGINKAITMQVSITGVSSSMAEGYLYIMNSGGGVLVQHHYNSASGSTTFTAQPGETFTIYIDGAGLSFQDSTLSGTISLYNLTSGGHLLGQTSVSGAVSNSGTGNP